MPDGRLQFNAKNLPEMGNGSVGLAINHTIQQLLMDVTQRPGDAGKRSLTIKLDFTPDCDDSGTLDTIDIKAEVKGAVPTRKNSKAYKILPLANGTAIFTASSPGDPRQLPLPTMGGPDDGGEVEVAPGVTVNDKTGEVVGGVTEEGEDDTKTEPRDGYEEVSEM